VISNSLQYPDPAFGAGFYILILIIAKKFDRGNIERERERERERLRT
jgi:hypothetical protein